MQKYKIIINYFDISKNIVDKGKIRLIVRAELSSPLCLWAFEDVEIQWRYKKAV